MSKKAIVIGGGTIKGFVDKYTVFSAFLFSLLFTVITALVGLPTMQGDMEQKTGMPIFALYQVVLAVIGILFMKMLKILDKNDFRFKNAGKGLLLGWIIFILIIVLVLSNYSNRSEYFIAPEPLFLITVILFPLSTALAEETIYRGLILKILLKKRADTKKGIISSLIISAALFAAVHSVHLIWADPVTVASDLIFAVAGGMLLGAVYIRAKTLVAPILLHWFMNLSGGIFAAFTSPEYATPQASVSDIITISIVAVPIVISAFVLLEKAELAVAGKTEGDGG